ncbi:MAG: TIM barrel protein [Oscillospiraceae bacterium]|nr:TIM barrel protein [Oscillospiraceae bacterium]
MSYTYDRKGPKRGVSLYSYSEFGWSMTLEDCFADMYDMGAHGLEILSNAHVPYPEITDEFLEEWNRLCDLYEIVPVEYGHWIDTRLYRDRDLTVGECYQQLVTDFKIANKLGFHILRTKQGVKDLLCSPVDNWRDVIYRALDAAEQYDVCMCPEIHNPTRLNNPFVSDVCEFIDKTGTKQFGLNIDFSVFQTNWIPIEKEGTDAAAEFSTVAELEPLLPYVKCCHAKFHHVDENFVEESIPYADIINLMKEKGWDGYLLSELEGPEKRKVGGASMALRLQHIMMKRLMGD